MRAATKEQAKRVITKLRQILHPDVSAENTVAFACAIRVVNAFSEVCPPASPIPQGLPSAFSPLPGLCVVLRPHFFLTRFAGDK